jgi:hypothetical protein
MAKKIERMLAIVQLALIEVGSMPLSERKEITPTGFALICSKMSHGDYSVKEFSAFVNRQIIDLVKNG